MAVLLFRLRGVPEDEAEDVRELLDHHAINFYETSAGNWGISNHALWLSDTTQLAEAKNLIAEYQKQCQVTAKAEYQRLIAEGKNPTLVNNIKAHPLQFILYICLITLVFYISIRLVLDFRITN